MSDELRSKKEPSDGSSNWVEYRRMILSTLERLEERQTALDAKVDEIRQYLAGQKAILALVSLFFGSLGAGIVAFFKKGS